MLSRKKRANIFQCLLIVSFMMLTLATFRHEWFSWCFLASVLVFAASVIFMFITVPKPRPLYEQIILLAEEYKLDSGSALELVKKEMYNKGNFIAVPKIQTLTAYEQECQERCQKLIDSFKESIKNQSDILIFPEGQPECQAVIKRLNLERFYRKPE